MHGFEALAQELIRVGKAATLLVHFMVVVHLHYAFIVFSYFHIELKLQLLFASAIASNLTHF